jgi:hypothetical protein
VSLQTNQIQSLSTAAIRALGTSQFQALETRDLIVLTTTQVMALTSVQTASLSTLQVTAMLSTQIQALNTAAYAALDTSTPIILDLNGDGVKTLSISEGVKFDMFGDGKAINTGWVSSGDGLLVLDRNHDGTINSGSELFGSSTILSNGEKAPDGYAALRELDSNADGVISSQDAIYADLRVWVDSNSDGVSSAGELRTLDSLGIATINLNAAVGTNTDNGNILGLTSSYQTTDGTTHAAADVWFIADKGGVNASAGTLDAAIAAINANSTPTKNPLVIVPSIDESLALGQPVVPPVATNSDDLRSRVTSLAQAIGSFGSVDAQSSGIVAPNLNATSNVSTAQSPVALAATSMADVMKQFDSNGAMLGAPAIAAVASTASTTKSLNLPGIQDPANSGILTTGGKS